MSRTRWLLISLLVLAATLPGTVLAEPARPAQARLGGLEGRPAWDVVPTPNGGVGRNSLEGVSALSPTEVWAVGYSDVSSPLPLIERFDGSSWRIVDAPPTEPGFLYDVAALAPDDVWAVGGYERTGEALIMHWDGTRVSLVPHPNPGTLNQLYAVDAIAPDDIWAVGEYVQGLSRTLTMHWDGTAWRVVDSPQGAPGYNALHGVHANGPDDVWAVGYGGDADSLAMHWDGTAWSVVATPTPRQTTLRSVAGTGADDVWAVGDAPSGLVATHWDGAAWTSVPIPSPGTFERLHDVVAIGPDDVWAVGSADESGEQATLTQHWDGARWTVVPSPSPARFPNELMGVSAVSSGEVWAVGEADGTLVERFDGTSWTVVPSPSLGAGDNLLYGVKAFAPDDVWAVGSVDERTLIEHWDGTRFTIVPSPNVAGRDNVLEDVDGVAPDDVWAVGHADVSGFIGSQTLIQHWDGSSWTIVPSPSFGDPTDQNNLTGVAAVAPDDVWAVGTFVSISTSRSIVMHWNGVRWRPVRTNCGSGLSDVSAIAPNDVWAVGGGDSCHWNGTRWTRFDIAPPPDGRSFISLKDVDGAVPNQVWGVGDMASPCGKGVCFSGIVQRWNGSRWRNVTSAGFGLFGVEAVAPDDVWAVGLGFGPLIVHYDGTRWSQVPNPVLQQGGQLHEVDASGPEDLWAAGESPAGNDPRTLVEHAPSPVSGAVVGDTNVAFAVVSWFGPETGSTETNAFGEYQVGGLRAGQYTFTATAAGCTPGVAQVTVVAGETIRQDLTLGCS